MNLTNTPDKMDIRAALEVMSRGPFKDILADFVDSAPGADTLIEWAKKNPDRWAQATTIIGRLAGYNEKAEVQVNIKDYSRLSDAELMAAIADMDAELTETKLIELDAEPVDE